MSRMTTYRELHDITMKMTSYEKVPNTKVLRILTTYKIGFGVVFIRRHMQLVELKYYGRLTLDMVCPRARMQGCRQVALP